MDDMEMRTLGGAFRITEKLADFAGNIILQLMQKQGYVEKQGIEALLSHIREGGGTLTSVVSAERAEEFGALLRKEHIAYVELEHTDPQSKERSVFFVYRDSDREKAKQVLKEFELTLDRTCHEVDLDTFINVTDKKTYGMAEGFTKTEVYAFREAAKEYDMTFSVVQSLKKRAEDKDKYAVVCSDKDKLYEAVAKTCYDLSGVRGREYSFALGDFFQRESDFLERAKPEPGRVKYIVKAKNPSNFITIDEQGITTHSVGRRPERGADGVVRDVIYDARHVTYPGFDRGLLKQLALELKNPVILSQENFPLVHGLAKNKEAVLSQDFVKQFSPFAEAYKNREPDYGKVPVRRPLYVREEVTGLSGLPVEVIKAVTVMKLPDVYVVESDIAYPKEMEVQVEHILEELLYKDISPEERSAMKEEFSKEENRAVEHMLQVESNERAMVSVKNIPFPEALGSNEKEALQRLKEKKIEEHTMNSGYAKMFLEKEVSRRMEQEPER